MPHLNTSFCTIAYRNQPDTPLPAILAAIAEAGYNGVELWWPHVETTTPAQLTVLRQLADQLELTIPMVSPYLGNFNLEMTNDREMIDRIEGRLAADEAVVLLKRNTAQFAKRQMTHLRSLEDRVWVDVGPHEPAEETAARIEALWREHAAR
mgnify:CR=1 FL=1